MSSILIQGGRIIDPSQKRDSAGDLLIEDGKISAIDDPGKIPASRAQRLIDARGLWVTPGLIDVHVHLREPGLEYKETIETGTRAAVAGGFTSVACMANTHPVNDSRKITAFIRDRAKEVAPCRVFVTGAVTIGLNGEKLADLEGMVDEGARALSDDGMPIMNSLVMRRAMERAKQLGVPIISHAEDWNLVDGGLMNEGAISLELGVKGNPVAAEEIMVAREIALCRLTRNPIHIAHLSTAIALEHVRRAKEAGLPVTAEASPHHLTLSDSELRGLNTNFKMAPPLRGEEDVEALRKAVGDGLIDVIATDHAPHGEIDKNTKFEQAANGIIGLQTAAPVTLELVHSGIVSPSRWVESLTLGPARLLKIEHGTLRTGRPADVTLINPDQMWKFTRSEIRSKSHNSPYVDHELKGRVRFTIVNGSVVYEN